MSGLVRLSLHMTTLLAVGLLAACSSEVSSVPTIVVRGVATATARPSLTPLGGGEAPVLATPATAVVRSTEVIAAEATPEKATESAVATSTRRATAGPRATASATPGAQVTELTAHGLRLTFYLEVPAGNYRVDEKIWFGFTAANLTDAPLRYGVIGVTLPDGSFHTSLSGSALAPREVLPWRDWVALRAPGEHSLLPAVCFSPKDECRTGGTWVSMPAPMVVTVTQ